MQAGFRPEFAMHHSRQEFTLGFGPLGLQTYGMKLKTNIWTLYEVAKQMLRKLS
jgi:hypothetical protein